MYLVLSAFTSSPISVLATANREIELELNTVITSCFYVI